MTIASDAPITFGDLLASSGNLTVDNTGGITTTLLSAPFGYVHLTAHSPISIAPGGINAGTGISLSAPTSGSNSAITIGGTISTSGPVAIAAYGNVTQNANICGAGVSLASSTGVVAQAQGAPTTAQTVVASINTATTQATTTSTATTTTTTEMSVMTATTLSATNTGVTTLSYAGEQTIGGGVGQFGAGASGSVATFADKSSTSAATSDARSGAADKRDDKRAAEAGEKREGKPGGHRPLGRYSA